MSNPIIEKRFEFTTIRGVLQESCLFLPGKERVLEMAWQKDEGGIVKQLKLTWEALQILQKPDSLVWSNFHDYRQYLQRINPEGTYLEEEHIWDIFLCISRYKEISKYLTDSQEDLPTLFDERVNWNPSHLLKAIRDKFTVDGKLKDNASKELGVIRKEKRQLEGSINKLVARIFNQAISNGFVPDGMSVSIRNGRVVIPITAESKRKIAGIIQDHSATGSIVYLEPQEIIEATNKIQDFAHEEKKEIIKILTALCDEVRSEKESLIEVLEFLGLLDFTRAKALLARKLGATLPKIGNHNHIIRNGKHPLLLLQGKEVIPLNLSLNDKDRLLLISGPNAGGKSVALKSVGLFQYMLQCGLLVPVDEDSEFRIFDELFVEIGDQQSLENDLSTYSSHLKYMNSILELAGDNSLVLIDEFGSGTDPLLGGAIAEAILEGIVERRSWGVITTHYGNLKQFAERALGVSNGAMLFDKENLKPFYVLEQGRQGGSFALELAQNTGLPNRVIQRAKELVGAEAVSLEEILANLDKERKELANKLAELDHQKREAQVNREKYLQLKSEIDLKRKGLLEDASRKAEELLSKANREIEKTIRHIKENKAEKKETQKIRTKLDQFRKEKIEEHKPKVETSIKEKFAVNDAVEINEKGVVGEILEIRGSSAIVLVGNIKTKVKLIDLIKTDRKPVQSNQRTNYQFERGISQVKTSLDVRGKRVEEVIPEVDKFIDNALVGGLSILSILHGKGNGVLRKVIRDHIKKIKQVDKYESEHADKGGDGVTIIYLK